MICHGCGGVVGNDCFNPQECEQIARDMANDSQILSYEIQVRDEHIKQLQLKLASFENIISMRTQIITINGNKFLIGKLNPGHHEELWFRKMSGTAPASTTAEFIAKIGKMSIEQQEEYNFSLPAYREAIKGTDAENWPVYSTYIFSICENGKGI